MINQQSRQTYSPGSTGIKESLQFIERLSSEGFFGTLEVRFEAGNIVHLVEHRSLKPCSLNTPDKSDA